MKTSLFLGTAISALLVTGIAAAAPANFHADLNPEDVVGGSTAGSTIATADFTIDSATNTLCGKITFTPAPSDTTEPTSVDVYEGADGANGTNILNLPDTVTAGVLTVNYSNVPAATVADIVNAATPTYVQFATAGFPNPGGEARGIISAGGDGATCEGTAVDYQATGDTDAGTTADAGADSGSATSTAPTTSSSSSSSGATNAGDTSDSGGCSTTGTSSMSTVGFLVGLGLVVGAFSRKRKKA